METKSSLVRILWSLAYLSVAVVALRVANGSPPSRPWASPPQDRTVTRKPWRVEPVKVVAARNKKKENIEIGKAFDDDDDWLEGFTVTVINTSDKTVTAMNIEMVFRREPSDSRPPVAQDLYFGPSPSSPEYLHRDPNKVIKPGENGELSLSTENYQSLRLLLQRAGYPTNIKRMELEIREVGFEDGSMLLAGTLYLPDPNHPNDPTKRIRADKIFHHHRKNPQVPKSSSQVSFSKASLTSAFSTQCYAIDYSSLQHCDESSFCHTWNDLVDDFQEGYYTTEDSLVNCTYTSNGEHTCSNVLIESPRYVECCHPLECYDPNADEAANSCSGCPEDYDQIGNCCYAYYTSGCSYSSDCPEGQACECPPEGRPVTDGEPVRNPPS